MKWIPRDYSEANHTLWEVTEWISSDISLNCWPIKNEICCLGIYHHPDIDRCNPQVGSVDNAVYLICRCHLKKGRHFLRQCCQTLNQAEWKIRTDDWSWSASVLLFVASCLLYKLFMRVFFFPIIFTCIFILVAIYGELSPQCQKAII